MPKPSSTRRCAMCNTAIFCLMLLVSAFDANAGENRWRSRSDELPGLGSATPIIIAAGVIVAVVLISRVGKDKQKEEEKEEEEKKKDEQQDKAAMLDSLPFSCLDHENSTHTRIQNSQEQLLQQQESIPLSLYLAVRENGPSELGMERISPSVSNKTVVLGLSFNF